MIPVKTPAGGSFAMKPFAPHLSTALTANPHEKLIFHKNWRRPARRVGMGCGGQDLRHLGSGFELGAIFELKPSLVPPFRGHARRGAVCSPLIVSRRPRAVGSSPRDGGGTSGLTPARFDLDVAPQSRLNLDALSTNTRWSLQTRAVRFTTHACPPSRRYPERPGSSHFVANCTCL